MNSHSSIHTLPFLADSLVYIENLFDACSYSNAPVPVFRTNAHYKLSKICIIFVSGLCMEAIFITIETYIVLSKTVFDVLQLSIYINSPHLLSKKIYNNESIHLLNLTYLTPTHSRNKGFTGLIFKKKKIVGSSYINLEICFF